MNLFTSTAQLAVIIYTVIIICLALCVVAVMYVHTAANEMITYIQYRHQRESPDPIQWPMKYKNVCKHDCMKDLIIKEHFRKFLSQELHYHHILGVSSPISPFPFPLCISRL